jgi:hypothetical protein
LTGLARNEAMAGGTITRFGFQSLRSAACGLALLTAALGAMSCARVGRESPETEQPLKFDLQCEVAADGGLQCVLTMKNCGPCPFLVSRHVPISAKSEVLYPPGSRGFEVAVYARMGFCSDEFVYLSPRDDDHAGRRTVSEKFSLDSNMLLESDTYPAMLTVHGTFFVVALRGETDWQMENSSRDRPWEGTFAAQTVPFSVTIPLPKKPKAK